ncbi:MAG: PKD domain-containing protein [bacterium]|nr:PKD domain-containing protein [bacterium]
MSMNSIGSVTLLATATLLAPPLAAQSLPPDYVDELILGGWDNVVGGVFDANGRMYVAEQRGHVHIVENGVRLPGPLIDIEDEVGNWRDFGLLSIALDPDFLVNGHIYLYYVVDRHHLLFAGTGNYDPGTNQYYAATIGRITRYTADAATNFTTLVPGSRLVLLGDTIDSGVPILHESHGTGSIVFGEDGTLIASSGDGASYTAVDSGSHNSTYWNQALNNGIIRPAENVGAFRSQLIGSLNGKLIRIDPATGDGVPSNPFYDAGEPRSARSRVWCLGLRNPFRIALRPGTGQSNPAAGQPGAIYIGDVGWNTWEDIHVATEAGMNFGWPIFEGLTLNGGYNDALTQNLDAPNPANNCGVPFFRFQDLIKQEQLDQSPSFPNPCNGQQIPASTPTFMHRRPELDYRHGSDVTRIPVFSGNDAAIAFLGTPGSPVAGQAFDGRCAVAGVWHSGVGFDPVYNGLYFHMDYTTNWMRAIDFGPDDKPTEVLDFGVPQRPVFLTEDPTDGSLVYVPFQQYELRRIRFAGNVNIDPDAEIGADTLFGAGPLTVRFDGTSSTDPENGLLTFDWDFGDGGTSTEPTPLHTFAAGSNPTSYSVTLTVSDDAGGSDSTTYDVFLNNTPPMVEITSFVNGSTYSTQQSTNLPLAATVSDAEHGPSELSYEWLVSLHHSVHSHPEPPDTNPMTIAVIPPTPCDGEFYAYRIELTVTDDGGLSTHVESWIYPDCASTVAVSLDLPVAGTTGLPNQEIQLEATPSGPVERVEFYVDDELAGVENFAPYTGSWTPPAPGSYVLSALVVATDGSSASTPGRVIDVRTPLRLETQIQSSDNDGEESAGGVMSLTSSDLEFTFDGSDQTVGMRFQLDVPQGATITSGHVQFTTDEVGTEPTFLTIRAEASDDAPPITQSSSDLSSRPTTTALAPWFPSPWQYVQAIGILQRTSDLGSVLQEVVDRPGWQSGNRVLILVTGTGERTAESFDGTPEPARLVVEWDPPATPPIGNNYCSPNLPNSTGNPASITATGSADVTDNDLTLTAASMPLGEFGYFLASPVQGFDPTPGSSSGNFCLAGGSMLGRFDELVRNSGASGQFSIDVNLTAVPIAANPGTTAIQPGDSWNFQGWYRDGVTSNFTDGVSVLFE